MSLTQITLNERLKAFLREQDIKESTGLATSTDAFSTRYTTLICGQVVAEGCRKPCIWLEPTQGMYTQFEHELSLWLDVRNCIYWRHEPELTEHQFLYWKEPSWGEDDNRIYQPQKHYEIYCRLTAYRR